MSADFVFSLLCSTSAESSVWMWQKTSSSFTELRQHPVISFLPLYLHSSNIIISTPLTRHFLSTSFPPPLISPPSPPPVQTSSPACRVRCEWCWGWRWRLLSSWKRSRIAWTPCWSAATPWPMRSARSAGTHIKRSPVRLRLSSPVKPGQLLHSSNSETSNREKWFLKRFCQLFIQ